MLYRLSKHKLLVNLIPYIIVGVGFLLVMIAFINTSHQAEKNREQTERNRQQGLRGQTYNISTNCFQAVKVAERTDEYIKYCYDKAEEITGYKIFRFGKN